MRNNTVVVFDLDDTLIKEIDFLKSAYKEISNYLNGGENLYQIMMQNYYAKRNVFQLLSDRYDVSPSILLNLYRNHFPANLPILPDAINLIHKMRANGINLGIITDGRSTSQRNKLKACGLENLVDSIIISEEFGSEKPDIKNFSYFHKYNAEKYYYIGDNLRKDFVAPNLLGWITICLLDSGSNIHVQDLNISQEYYPKHFINKLTEIESLIITS